MSSALEPGIPVTMLLTKSLKLLCPFECNSYTRPQELSDHIRQNHGHPADAAWPQNYPPLDPSVVVRLVILGNQPKLLCPSACKSYVKLQNLANHICRKHTEVVNMPTLAPGIQPPAPALSPVDSGPSSPGLFQQHGQDGNMSLDGDLARIGLGIPAGLASNDLAEPHGGGYGAAAEQQSTFYPPYELSPTADTMQSMDPSLQFDDDNMGGQFGHHMTGISQGGTASNSGAGDMNYFDGFWFYQS